MTIAQAARPLERLATAFEKLVGAVTRETWLDDCPECEGTGQVESAILGSLRSTYGTMLHPKSLVAYVPGKPPMAYATEGSGPLPCPRCLGAKRIERQRTMHREGKL